MAYKAIRQFKETKHDGHIYNVGDEYPTKGFKLAKSRADELKTNKNKYKVPFLEEVKESKAPAKDKE